jgi:hypothetical protein
VKTWLTIAIINAIASPIYVRAEGPDFLKIQKYTNAKVSFSAGDDPYQHQHICTKY